MAIFHDSITIVTRGKGKSAVAAAAYQSGTKMVNEWDGVTHDYTRKKGVVYSEIMLPENAPASLSDRYTLWNSVELRENRCNAQLARSMELSFPIELDFEENLKIAHDYFEHFRADGMVVDFSMQEFDKVSFSKDTCTYSNKRFLLTTEKVEGQATVSGTTSRALAYLNKLNSLYVTTPIGADIFKVAGGGQNYVHGGSSLQEMLVPVVEVRTAKGKQETDYVDVILTTISRKVTNLISSFDFIQTEKVTDVMKARNLVAYFATEFGEKISFDVPIMANRTADAPDKRTFREKFTLKSREYKFGDKYYMHIADANNDKNILHSYEFMIDIAFVDDFGF